MIFPSNFLKQPKVSRRFGWLRGTCGLALVLAALPTASLAQVSVTVVQESKPGPRSLCRIEACNLAHAPIQIGGGLISQLATTGGFPVVAAGEEEQARQAAQAGVRRSIRDVSKKLLPIIIQATAVLAVVRKYPVQAQGALAAAALAVELIPAQPTSTLPFLRSAEMLALPAGGCEVRYIRARTTTWNPPLVQIIGKHMDGAKPETGTTSGATFEFPATPRSFPTVPTVPAHSTLL